MSLPRFLTDEDVYAAVAPALRNSGLDAISTPETKRLASDSQTSHSLSLLLARDESL